jgi:hypothetical protein
MYYEIQERRYSKVVAGKPEKTGMKKREKE